MGKAERKTVGDQEIIAEHKTVNGQSEQNMSASSNMDQKEDLETARGEGWALRKRPRHREVDPDGAFSYVADLDAITRYPYKVFGVEDSLYPSRESLEFALWTG